MLNKLLGARPSEIAKAEGKRPSAVRGLIIRVSDRLRSGEISLLETDDPEKEKEAKAKLEAQREKRRARYAKNREVINKRRREAYVPKTTTKIKTDQETT